MCIRAVRSQVPLTCCIRHKRLWFSLAPREVLLPPINKVPRVHLRQNGCCPDSQKVTVLTDMPVPTEMTTLRSFLGMVSYYQSFIPNMRSICQPLDLRKNNEWKLSVTANKRLAALKAFLILASSLTMTCRLK
jgi:hypothetical protein